MRRIIVLDRWQDDRHRFFDVVFRLPITLARHSSYADPEAAGLVNDSEAANELLAIRAGEFIEVRETLGYPKAWTIAETKAAILTNLAAAKAAPPPPPRPPIVASLADDESTWAGI